MSIEIRPKDGTGPTYSPHRDVAYVYPKMLASLVQSMNSDYWPEVKKAAAILYKHWDDEDAVQEFGEKSWDELCDANDSYWQFLAQCAGQEDASETYDDVMDRSGFMKHHPSAQVAYLAMMGMVMTGQFFLALRDITPLGSGTNIGIKEIVDSGKHSRRSFNNRTSVDDHYTAVQESIDELAKSVPIEVVQSVIQKYINNYK